MSLCLSAFGSFLLFIWFFVDSIGVANATITSRFQRQVEEERPKEGDYEHEEEIPLIDYIQRRKTYTTTTSTSQVSWQHPLLENPIRHCIISRTASAL